MYARALLGELKMKNVTIIKKLALLVFVLLLFPLTSCKSSSLQFKTLVFENNEATIIVSNSTTTFSFLDEITTSKSINYFVSYDLEGSNTIPTKIASLYPGENTFYITETKKDVPIKTYKVVIHRNRMFSITFYGSNNTFHTLQVEEGCLITPPDFTPEKTGYSFKAWDYDFSIPASSNLSINASWTPVDYSITYKMNGHTNNPNNPTSYNIENSYSLLPPTSTIDGYVFSGWNCNGKITNIIPQNTTGNIELSPVFNPIFTLSGNTITGLTSYGEKLSSIVIPSKIDGVKITAIADYAFWQDRFSSIIIPNTVTNIGKSAFSACTHLESITIPDSVISIGESCFFNCKNLKSAIIGNSITEIPGAAFNLCSNLESVTLPNSITSIGESAFSNCKKLLSISTPNQLENIGAWAFSNCYSLTSFYIHSNISTIGAEAFNGCSNLTIYCELTEKHVNWATYWNGGANVVWNWKN